MALYMAVEPATVPIIFSKDRRLTAFSSVSLIDAPFHVFLGCASTRSYRGILSKLCHVDAGKVPKPWPDRVNLPRGATWGQLRGVRAVLSPTVSPAPCLIIQGDKWSSIPQMISARQMIKTGLPCRLPIAAYT